MYKLKRSGLYKAICLILSAVFLCITAGGTVLTLTKFFDSDLLFPDEKSFHESILDDPAYLLSNNTAYGYGLLSEVVWNNNTDDFLQKYPSLLSKRTNAAITLTDEKGKVLFSNFTVENPKYSFTYRYTVDFYADGSSSIGGRWNNTDWEYATANSEITREATTAPFEETETTLPGEEAVSEQETTTIPEEITSEPELAEIPAENSYNLVKSNEDVYVENGTIHGYNNDFMYIYPREEGRNDLILAFCLSLYHDEIYPDAAEYYRNYEIYWQEDFGVSSNNNVYYKLTSEDHTELTTYYPWEPEIIKTQTYTMTIDLGDQFTVKDAFYYYNLFADISYQYLTHAVRYTLISLVLGLLFLILALSAGGYVKGIDEPVARGLHKIPSDLMIALAAAAITLLVAIFYDYTYHYDAVYIVLMVCAIPLFLLFIYISAVKIKTKTFVSSMLILRIVKWCKRWVVTAFKEASNAVGLLWKLGIYFVLSLIVAVFVIVVTDDATALELLLYALFKIAELALFLYLGINLHTLQEGAKNISEGRYKKIENRFLFGEFKKNANYLNSINQGVSLAVEERLKSETTKSELITNVSHDLKTPLTSIVNYIDLLKREEIENPKAEEYIEVIDRQSQRLKKLTTDIVDASKAAAGSIKMQLEDTDLSVLLSQVKGEYTEKLLDNNLILVDAMPETKLLISADGQFLWRVLDNLMNNICKYSLHGTRVYVNLTDEGNKAKIVFRNISKTELNITPDALTERFVRGDTSRNTEGSGLGLYIARSLTENMGGAFTIDIDGDLFKVTLEFNKIN